MFSMLIAAAAYSMAFVIELLRFFRWRHCLLSATFVPAIIGFVFHTFFLYQQHVAAHSLGGTAMFFFTAAWGLIFIYFIWAYRYPRIPFGVILLPVALLLLIGGHLSISTFETTGPSLRSLAKMLHLVSAAGFVIALAIFVVCRLLYFLEVRLLRKKRSFAHPIKLPSLEWLVAVSRISLVVILCCLCLCALGGIMLNVHF